MASAVVVTPAPIMTLRYPNKSVPRRSGTPAMTPPITPIVSASPVTAANFDG